MTIHQLLAKNYDEMKSYCIPNLIKRCEIKSGIKDIEEIDLLNTLCIRWLTKYDKFNLPEDVFYNKIKMELSGERMHFWKQKKGFQYSEILYDTIDCD